MYCQRLSAGLLIENANFHINLFNFNLVVEHSVITIALSIMLITTFAFFSFFVWHLRK